MTRRSRNLLIAGVLLALLAVVGTVTIIRAATTALDAENRFHAAIITHAAIRRFEADHGRRPGSWKDFEALAPLEWSSFQFPRDVEAIQDWVRVDFVSLQSADPVTTAIHPTGPIYSGWEDLLPSTTSADH
jgi:hypothetical protein